MMRIELHLSTGVKKEKEARSTYLGLSVGGWGKEGVETLLLQKVGGQACEAIPGVERNLNDPMRKEQSGIRKNKSATCISDLPDPRRCILCSHTSCTHASTSKIAKT
jgi:hypothetical protein